MNDFDPFEALLKAELTPEDRAAVRLKQQERLSELREALECELVETNALIDALEILPKNTREWYGERGEYLALEETAAELGRRIGKIRQLELEAGDEFARLVNIADCLAGKTSSLQVKAIRLAPGQERHPYPHVIYACVEEFEFYVADVLPDRTIAWRDGIQPIPGAQKLLDLAWNFDGPSGV